MLHRCDVDVVYGGEVEDDGFEGGEVGRGWKGSSTAGARVVPWAVLESEGQRGFGLEDRGKRESLRLFWGRSLDWCGGFL